MLCSPDWLNENLGNPSVRIFDCSIEMRPQPVGRSILISGKDEWARAHIPGAQYLLMPDELSSPTETILFGLPSPDHVQQVMRSHGVNDDDTIVLYSRGYIGPIVRVWWVLMASGARDVRVLDGGFEGWRETGFALTDLCVTVSSWGDFTARPRPDLRADIEDVAAALHDPDVVLVNALSPEQFVGSGGANYGRPGRIPESASVPLTDLLRPGTSWFRSLDEIAAIFDAAGVLRHSRIISYCGGGIAASGTTFALHLIGRTDASLYDGSLAEWSADPLRPMILGSTERTEAPTTGTQGKGRRKAFERMVARLELRGYQFEGDPSFMESVEDWIEGRIEISKLRTLYGDLVRSRHRQLNR